MHFILAVNHQQGKSFVISHKNSNLQTFHPRLNFRLKAFDNRELGTKRIENEDTGISTRTFKIYEPKTMKQ